MKEKRKPNGGGRIVVSKGPIIRGLEIANAFIGICAVVALVVALSDFSKTLDQQKRQQRHDVHIIQESRMKAAVDSCFLLRELVLVSGTSTHQPAQAKDFINTTPLSNCNGYAQNVTRLKGGGSN